MPLSLGSKAYYYYLNYFLISNLNSQINILKIIKKIIILSILANIHGLPAQSLFKVEASGGLLLLDYINHETDYRNLFRTIGAYSSVYFRREFLISERFSVSGGIGYSRLDFDKSKHYTSFKYGLLYKINNRWVANAYHQNNFSLDNTVMYRLSAPNLMQFYATLDLGISFKKNKFAYGLSSPITLNAPGKCLKCGPIGLDVPFRMETIGVVFTLSKNI
jgi:hypothetical protein